MKKIFTILLMGLMTGSLSAQVSGALHYNAELSGTASSGDYAPIWLTANRHGLGSVESLNGYLRAGVSAQIALPRHWQVDAGVDLVGGLNMAYNVWLHQVYADLSWKDLRLSIGSKERGAFPVSRDLTLSSGMMVEGANAQPIPQVRLSLDDFVNVPFTRQWFAIKGHIAYGKFMDDRWQCDFSGPNQLFTQDVLYHSKSLAFRIGKRTAFPLELELGIIDIAQFAGDRYLRQADGTIQLNQHYPKGAKSFWKAFLPFHQEGNANVEGNHSGSWQGALTWYGHDWKIRAYMEHFFEDHSQIGFEYGMWRDGQLGIEVELPKNPWISKFLWEGLCTTDQTGAILYDSFSGSFTDIQISGGDEYFTNHQYLGWQHAGMGMTNPLIPGPAYNTDGSNRFRSSRVKAHHIGLAGHPADEWQWRLLASDVRHWGTYPIPLDKVRHQFSGLLEVGYTPHWGKGLQITAALAYDNGNYLGNSFGGQLTLRHSGEFFRFGRTSK